MLSYHQIIKWHEQYDPAMHISETEQDEPSAEATYNKNYIQQKLEHGLNRIWKVCFSNEFGIVVCLPYLALLLLTTCQLRIIYQSGVEYWWIFNKLLSDEVNIHHFQGHRGELYFF